MRLRYESFVLAASRMRSRRAERAKIDCRPAKGRWGYQGPKPLGWSDSGGGRGWVLGDHPQRAHGAATQDPHRNALADALVC